MGKIQKKFTPSEVTKIQKLRKNGMAIDKIAKEIHRSKNLVSLFLKNPDQFNKINPEKKAAGKKEKMIRVDNDKSVGPTEKDIKNFNRVLLEHRSVIKYLTKKGIGPRFIFEEMRKVYGPPSPTMTATLFWCKQFKQGRLSISNHHNHNNNNNNNDTQNNKFGKNANKIITKKPKAISTEAETEMNSSNQSKRNPNDTMTTAAAASANKVTPPEKKLLHFKFGLNRLAKNLDNSKRT